MTFASGSSPQRIIAKMPQAWQPTSTGTTVGCPSLVVVIHVFVVQAEFDVSSVEKLGGAKVTVPVIIESGGFDGAADVVEPVGSEIVGSADVIDPV